MQSNTNNKRKALFWFRMDLRLEDNKALTQALSENDSVTCVFIFETEKLKHYKKKDFSLNFLYLAVENLKKKLNEIGSDLIVKKGNPQEDILELSKKLEVTSVYTNKVYQHKDNIMEDIIEQQLYKENIVFHAMKENVMFSPDEILDMNGNPFKDFYNYRNLWHKSLRKEHLFPAYEVGLNEKFQKFEEKIPLPKLENLGFVVNPKLRVKANKDGAIELFNKFKPKLKKYGQVREIVGYAGVSFMSMYIKFGIISLRYLLREASAEMKTLSSNEQKDNVRLWIDQWIRREFYTQQYYHNPKLLSVPYKEHYDNMPWENNMSLYYAWCSGETGYPIIDAAMKQLVNTGYMHYRMRQLTATFLTKILFIDYRYGEAFFASNLIDYNPAMNNAGWQWAASVNYENNSYIKMFNPTENSQKFDQNALFIKKYLPNLSKVSSKALHEPWNFPDEFEKVGLKLGEDYPLPVVDYRKRRDKVLKEYENINKL